MSIKNSFHKFGAWVGVLPILLIPSSVFASAAVQVKPGLSSAEANMGGVAGGAGLTTGTGQTDLPILIGNMIGVILGVIGILLVVMVIYAGILYMTAAGDDTKVKTAKKLLINSIIGIVLIVAAYSISSFVINQIVTATKT